MKQKKTIKDISATMKVARESLDKNKLPIAMDLSDSVLRSLAILNISDPSVIRALVKSKPTENQLMASEAIVTLGATFCTKAQNLQRLKNRDIQAITEAFVASESYLWIAANYQAAVGDFVSLIVTIIGICDLHAKKDAVNEDTRDLLQQSDALTSTLEKSGKFDKDVIKRLRVLNKKVTRKLHKV